MNDSLTSAQIEQIKIEIQKHFVSFTARRISKTDSAVLAAPYAENLFTRLTNNDQMVVRGTPASHAKPDISFQRWIEETYDSSPNRVLENVLLRSAEILLDWHVATKIAVMFIEKGAPVPEPLRVFTIDVMLGRKALPKSRGSFSSIASRNDALFSCVYWLTSDSPSSIRALLGITTPISIYSNSDAATDTPTAATLICDAINNLEFKKTNSLNVFLNPETVISAYKSAVYSGGALNK